MWDYLNAAGIRQENNYYKQGEMKKKLFAIPLALGMALGMAGCGSSSETTTKVETTTTETTTIAPTTTSTPKTYTIKVYDIDGELIGDKTVDLKECPTVNDALDKYFDVKKLIIYEIYFSLHIHHK
jgi:ABC-type glycerol-3-phosphate transport system substrate-binding protein